MEHFRTRAGVVDQIFSELGPTDGSRRRSHTDGENMVNAKVATSIGHPMLSNHPLSLSAEDRSGEVDAHLWAEAVDPPADRLAAGHPTSTSRTDLPLDG
jgi:hypothetical protein